MAIAICPLQHAREAVAHFVGRRAERHRARDVGRPVLILPARIAQEQGPLGERPIGGPAIMRQRAIGPDRRNRVERQILERPGLAPQRLEMVGGADLVDLARGVVLLDPAQEAGDRRPVARLRRLVPGDLDLILDRLGQHHRIARVEDRRPRRLERLRDRRHRPLGIDRHGLAAQARANKARTRRARAAARHCQGARGRRRRPCPRPRTGPRCRRHGPPQRPARPGCATRPARAR